MAQKIIGYDATERPIYDGDIVISRGSGMEPEEKEELYYGYAHYYDDGMAPGNETKLIQVARTDGAMGGGDLLELPDGTTTTGWTVGCRLCTLHKKGEKVDGIRLEADYPAEMVQEYHEIVEGSLEVLIAHMQEVTADEFQITKSQKDRVLKTLKQIVPFYGPLETYLIANVLLACLKHHTILMILSMEHGIEEGDEVGIQEVLANMVRSVPIDVDPSDKKTVKERLQAAKKISERDDPADILMNRQSDN